MSFFNREPQQPTGETSQVEQQQAVPFYQSNQELGRMMLDTAEDNKRVYHRLLGMSEDEHGKIVRVDDPLMNKKGASHFYMLLEKINSKDTFLTKLTDYDVVTTTHRIWREIIVLLLQNEKEWELPKQKSKWSIIREIIITPIYHALRRGENGLEKEFFRAVSEFKTLSNQNNQQQFKKGGFFG